jgi:hypothetical protein
VASSQKQESLAALAKLENPFDQLDALVQKLESEKAESRYLEWKLMLPFGNSTTIKLKYRLVKAVLSFANTDGGFVLFGVDPKGTWTGFSWDDLNSTDPAMLVELINGCISPEISGLNYANFERNGRFYSVLHTPPSPSMPHVTTKEIGEVVGGKRQTYLSRYAVYCRYGAKSDLATSHQFARIIERRTEYLRSEMLRRIKEIRLPVNTPGTAQPGLATILRVTRADARSNASAIRITRDPNEATGIVVHEELGQDLFAEINNVIDANNLLSKSMSFVFGEEIYYRIYAERQHVIDSSEQSLSLAKVALKKFYAPMLFWLLRLPPVKIAEALQLVPFSSKSPHSRLICRIALLLGESVTAWLQRGLQHAWGKHPQPPEHFFAFKKMLAKIGSLDPRLIALQMSEKATLDLPFEPQSISIRRLLDESSEASSLLSRASICVFEGDVKQRSLCRVLDVLAYGAEFRKIGQQVSQHI